MLRPFRFFLLALTLGFFADAATVLGQWIDVKSLPPDVLNCDECRRRLGLPPLANASSKSTTHHSDSTIAPTSKNVFNEIVLSSRVLSGSEKDQAATQPREVIASPSPTKIEAKPAVPSLVPRVSISKELPANDTSNPSASAKPSEESLLPKPMTSPAILAPANNSSSVLKPLGSVKAEPPVESKSIPAVQPQEKKSKEKGSSSLLEVKPKPAPKIKQIVEQDKMPAASKQPSKPSVAKPDETAAILSNRKPPALTEPADEIKPTIAAAAPKKVESIQAQEIAQSASDEPIAVAVPTKKPTPAGTESTDAIVAAAMSKLSDNELSKPSEKKTTSPSDTPSSVSAPISTGSLVVDGILTSPAAQKIEIDLLKKQLQERDLLLNELSRMQRVVERGWTKSSRQTTSC